MSKKEKLASAVVLLLVLFWCGAMSLVAYRNVVAWRTRVLIRKVLEAPDTEFVVTVNGRPAPDGAPVLGAIRSAHLRMAHHTYPTHMIPVVIRGKTSVLELTLARDSAISDEYWIFWTRDAGTPNRPEIGRIETSVFDGE